MCAAAGAYRMPPKTRKRATAAPVRTRQRTDPRNIAKASGMAIRTVDDDGVPLMAASLDPTMPIIAYLGMQYVLGQREKGLQRVYVCVHTLDGYYITSPSFAEAMGWCRDKIKGV